jgi:hypothetical protein
MGPNLFDNSHADSRQLVVEGHYLSFDPHVVWCFLCAPLSSAFFFDPIVRAFRVSTFSASTPNCVDPLAEQCGMAMGFVESSCLYLNTQIGARIYRAIPSVQICASIGPIYRRMLPLFVA